MGVVLVKIMFAVNLSFEVALQCGLTTIVTKEVYKEQVYVMLLLKTRHHATLLGLNTHA